MALPTSDVPITAATGAANALTAGEWIYGMDFRPADGVLWGLTNKGRLYTIDPATGFSFVAGVAYTNSFAGAQTTTTLYTINNSRDNLSTQTPPANGTQTTVGALGVAIDEVQGFDIGGSTNQLALGALRTSTAGPHSLYNINLTTGAAVFRPATTGTAEIGGPAGLPVVDIAIRR